MHAQRNATVRMFGTLQTLRKDRGLEPVAEVSIPSCGCAASVLARELGLPLERIEAVFVNHQAYYLDHCIQAGDSVTFVSKGNQGPAHGPFEFCRASQNSNG